MKDFLVKYKSSVYSLVLFVSIFVVFKYRENKKEKQTEVFKTQFHSISGNTMGTTYSIKYIGEENKKIEKQIDSVLLDLNNSVSTYIPTSEISEFNTNGKVVFRSTYFKTVLEKSKEIFERTKGAFDPTVMPLVNAYGFGYEDKNIPNESELDSLCTLVGFDKINFDNDSAWTIVSNVKLDFSAIAKGYGVDVVSEFLKNQKIANFMVEIGGEVRCSGKSIENKDWVIGVINPLYPSKLYRKVTLNNKSMATSGNYRNFYEENGIKYSHTINPKTGKVERNTILSATVVTKTCMEADALATASMVLGIENAIKAIAQDTNFRVFYIYSDGSDENSFSSLE